MQACFTKTLIIVLFIQADFFLLLVFLRVIDSEISIWIEMTKLSGICCPEPIHSFMQDLHTVMHHGDDKRLPLHRRILTSSSYCNPHYKAGRRQQVSCGKDWPSTRCGSASKGRVHKATNSGEFPFFYNDQLLYLQDHQKLPSATPSTQARYSAKLPTAIRCRQAGGSLVAYPFPVITGLLRTWTTTALPCQLPENA